MRLVAGTNAVNTEEWCLSLAEVDLPSPLAGQGIRRYQVLYVMRGDKPAEFRRDLGPARSFRSGQFRIPGGVWDDRDNKYYVEHTVGELIDIADYLRSDRYAAPERPAATDLVRAYQDLPDKRRAWRKKRSQFGPLSKVQRD